MRVEQFPCLQLSVKCTWARSNSWIVINFRSTEWIGLVISICKTERCVQQSRQLARTVA